MTSAALVFAAASLVIGELPLNTYPFSDPDPVPATGEARWPYFRYDGASATGMTQIWQTVVLENKHLRLTIVPAVGGKVWGATDKATGRDFIYFNHAAKFRNIAMRGPWASGGIEFNFGIIGHSPSSSTPVDWCVRTNTDGSVSYFCGNTELINRTTWQVEVRLGEDDAFFTTRTRWHNGSNLPCPYYHWMNAAYSTRGDPELVFPGSFQVGHEGDAHPWPIDEAGRDIHFVNANDFGGNKSYHICGGDTRLFGVWWKDWNFGSYHRNDYGEKYGRKVWMWALSREGGVWENLLTDSDGQYMELQSGRGFNQPRRKTWQTPFKHPTFAPGGTDEFAEEWGLWRDRREFEKAWDVTNAVERAQIMPDDFDWTTAYGLFLRGEQALRERDDVSAEKFLRLSLKKDQCFSPSLVTLAELCFRRAKTGEASDLAEKALRINAYDPAANYWSGRAARIRGEASKALERLGLSAYSPYWRAAACAEMSKIYLSMGDWGGALAAAEKCRAANAKSIDGFALSVLALRELGRTEAAESVLRESLAVWPLSRVLQSLNGGGGPTCAEWPSEVELETAFWFLDCGRMKAAKRHFDAAKCLMGDLMLAWIDRDNAALDRVASEDIRFAFAFRREYVPVLDWAMCEHRNWRFKYLRAQFAAANGDEALAKRLLDAVEDADDAVFYIYRGTAADLDRAAKIEDSWRIGRAKMKLLADAGRWSEVKLVGEAYLKKFPECNPIQILYAKSLLELKDYDGCLDYLSGVSILPSEFGDNATDIWQAAQREKGLEETWPESLGKGKPYEDEPDTFELPVTGAAWGCGANTDPNFLSPDLNIVFADRSGKETKETFCDVHWMGTHILTGKIPAGKKFVRAELSGGKKEYNRLIRIGKPRLFREKFPPLDIRLSPREKLPFPVRQVATNGFTKVTEVSLVAGARKEVRLPEVDGKRVVRSFPVPYLTFGERKDRAVVELLDDGTFRFAYFDWTVSNASKVEDRGRVARYLPRTDGKYNPVRERMIVKRSRNFEDVLPDIPNPPSPWRHETGTRVWRSHASSVRADDIALWREVKKAGMDRIAVTDHETMWRDNGEPFTFCTVAAAGKGGDAGAREYSRVMREELGFRYGPYNNFTDLASASPYFTRDRVGRRADGSFQPAWMRCYGPKPAIAPQAAREFTPILKSKFGFDCVYCDVHTSQLPWYRTDYDARVPGAATYAAVFYAWGEALLSQRELIGGPVWSEGAHHFMYAGLVDGSYGHDRGYDFEKEPWIVDFDLLKMHPLNCDFGMGSLSMFSPPKSDLEMQYYLPGTPKGRDHLIARFLAATLAFGHAGYLILDSCWDPAKPFGSAYGVKCNPLWRKSGLPAEALRSYFIIQAIAARYTQSTVESIRYVDREGRQLTTSDAIRSGVVGRNQIVVKYRDGTVVVVNGSESEPMKTLVGARIVSLGPIGYQAWSTGVEVESDIVDGRRRNFCRAPEYEYREIEGERPHVVLKGVKK